MGVTSPRPTVVSVCEAHCMPRQMFGYSPGSTELHRTSFFRVLGSRAPCGSFKQAAAHDRREGRDLAQPSGFGLVRSGRRCFCLDGLSRGLPPRHSFYSGEDLACLRENDASVLDGASETGMGNEKGRHGARAGRDADGWIHRHDRLISVAEGPCSFRS
jgi:hypothetical protein